MSVQVMGWALEVPVGGNMKVVLLGLANHAHPDGSNTYPSLDTLARYAACDRSTARRNVRKLVEDGWIVEDGTGPKGTTQYLIRVDRTKENEWGGKTPPVAPEPAGGGTGAAKGVAPVPPEPSIEPNVEPTSFGGDAREPAPGEQASLIPAPAAPKGPAASPAWPAGFDVSMVPVAVEAHAVLTRAANARKGAKVPKVTAVAAAMVANPRRAFVQVATQLEFWLVHGNGARQPARDVVQRWANWLSREDEVTDGSGRPVAPTGGYRNGSSRSAEVAANMDLLESLSSPNPADRWE